jgi:hypothetical protein
MAKEVHEGDDKDYLHNHKLHMTPQIPSQTSILAAINIHET